MPLVAAFEPGENAAGVAARELAACAKRYCQILLSLSALFANTLAVLPNLQVTCERQDIVAGSKNRAPLACSSHSNMLLQD